MTFSSKSRLQEEAFGLGGGLRLDLPAEQCHRLRGAEPIAGTKASKAESRPTID
jgi:hypothetical protein